MTDEHTGLILFKDAEWSISNDFLNRIRIYLYGDHTEENTLLQIS